MKFISSLFILCVCYVSSFAQTADHDAVKATVDRFFEGMKKNDSTISKQTVLSNAMLRTIAANKTGEVVTTDMPVSGLLKAIGTPHSGVYDERLTAYDIKIDGPMAMAWTPYEFYVDDKFSHCGVDVFLLAKKTDGWKIVGITDTRRKTDCVK